MKEIRNKIVLSYSMCIPCIFTCFELFTGQALQNESFIAASMCGDNSPELQAAIKLIEAAAKEVKS